jgi:hypothetical protein
MMGDMRWSSALALFVVTLTVVTGATAAASSSGLRGTVRRGPITPVCRVGVACDAPAPGVVLTFSHPGLVRKARTDQKGAYRVALPPGTYSVTTSLRLFGRTPRPARVRVRAGHWDKIVFSVDTGIR